MKILVTGGAGFIGSHVVDLYIKQGHEVVVVDDLSTGRLSNLNPQAVFYQCDIRSPELREVFETERPDIVNHHAAQMNVRRSVRDPLFDAEVNILGSLNLIENSNLFDIQKFIYISTGGAVYGEPEYIPCDEEHPVNPICQYGASKHTVEHYLYLYSINYGLDYNVIRYPNVYGPRQDPLGEAGVVAIFMGQMLSGEQVIINGDGEQTRDYVYVEDCAHANLLLLEAQGSRGIYNLGSGVGTSVNEIFHHLREITGYSLEPVHGPAKVGETRHIYLDATKARDDLGWTPRWSLEEGLLETVDYFEHVEMVPHSADKPTPSMGDVFGDDVVEEKSSTVNLSEGKGDGSIVSQKALRNMQVSRTLEQLHSFEQEIEAAGAQNISYRRVLEFALEAVSAASGSVVALNSEGEIAEAYVAYQSRIDQSAPDRINRAIKNGLAGWVLKEGRAALVKSTKDEPRWLKTSWEDLSDTSRSAMSVPLVENGQTKGVLTLTHNKPNHFGLNDLAVLTTTSALLSARRH
jgi:UDP-glucose 4-epimerase